MSYPLLAFGLWLLGSIPTGVLTRTQRWWRSGAGVSAIALASPPLYDWSGRSLPSHMVAHIALMFLVPLAVTQGGSFLGVGTRVHPMVAIGLLNMVMIAAHVPVIFNATMRHDILRMLVVEPLFVASGVWFFAVVLTRGEPEKPTKMRWQFIGVILTTVTMFVTAMAMSIFTKVAWYESMASMPGMTMAGDFRSQQLGAAILWICGDVWAVPVFVVLVRRVIERDGSLLSSLDRYLPTSG